MLLVQEKVEEQRFNRTTPGNAGKESIMCTCAKCNPQPVESGICTSELAAEVTAGVIGGLLAVTAVGFALFFAGKTILEEVKYSAKQKGRREVQEEIEAERGRAKH